MKCTKCELEKEVEAFPWKNKGKGTRHKTCKDCQKAIGKQHYENNKEMYLVKAVKNRKIQVGRNRVFVWNYLSEHPCVDCGESDPLVLQFDHVRGKNKNIGELVSSSLIVLKAEIALCDIRCANCHMRRTGSMYGWRNKPV